MPDIFLSYSRDDQPTARRFAEGLQREGLSVWWDQALSAGEAFDKVTEQALDEAKAVVVLWSKKSVDSRWVRAEATQANANNRLVPVMIEPCRRPIMFELTHTADLSGWQGDASDPDWGAFIDGLRKNVARQPGGPEAAAQSTHHSQSRRRRRSIALAPAVSIAVLAMLVGGSVAWFGAQQRAAQSATGPSHVSMVFSAQPSRWPMGARNIAISRDGSAVAFSGTSGVQIRNLGSSTPFLAGGRSSNPVFSPDGAWLATSSEPAGISKTPVAGGAPVLLAAFTERPAGIAWSSSGWILYATTAGLFRVSQEGGEPELLAKPDSRRKERLLAWPELLPGDKAALLTLLFEDQATPPQIVHFDLATHESRVVLSGGSSPRYSLSGHLLYASGQDLHAIAFDPAAGKTSGTAALIMKAAFETAQDNGAAQYGLSANGTLVSIPPAAVPGSQAELVWFDRKGNQTLLPLPPALYRYPRISPDGQRIAIDVGREGRDVWIFDMRRSSLSQLTRGPTEDMLPLWSVDGQRVFFASDRGGNFDIYSQAADGSGDARLEVAAPGMQAPHDFTPDGRQLVLIDDFQRLVLSTPGGGAPQSLLKGSVPFWLSALSPDGHWLVYESRESGTQTEIFLRPFPDVNARREKISVDGGRYPKWGPRGSNELFYVDPKGRMMSARITLEPELKLGGVVPLFDWRKPPDQISGQPFDVSSQDGRFLMTRLSTVTSNGSTQVDVVLNWFDELRQKVP